MDAIWSPRRYGDHFEVLTNKGNSPLITSSERQGGVNKQNMKTSLSDFIYNPDLGDSHTPLSSSENDEALSAQPLCAQYKQRIALTPRPQMDVLFKDVSATINGRQILDNVSGFCNPGEVLAVMGHSGSGKTTLLNILNGQHKDCSGTVLIGGRQITRRMRHLIGYATQFDVFHTELTLRKMLEYTARLRLPESQSYDEKMAAVDDILHLLDLTQCQHTVIGDCSKTGLSGGEKKRANIACELLTSPPVLLLDEPTSGLDSSTACNLIRKLKMIAQHEQKTIIVTLHQPSSQIFYLIDRLLLLCNGKSAYFGLTCQVVPYLSSLGLHLAPHYNPADFLLEATMDEKLRQVMLENRMIDRVADLIHQDNNYNKTISIHHSINEHDPISTDCFKCKKGQKCDVEIYVDEEMGKINNNKVEKSNCTKACTCSCHDDVRWSTSFYTQVKVLTARNFAVSTKIVVSTINWVQTVGLGLMAGLLWFQTNRTEKELHDIRGWIFFSTTYWMMHSHFQVLNTFTKDWNIVKKERLSGSYRMSSYYIAKTLCELPLTMVLPGVYLCISYPLLGASNVTTFFLHLSMLVLNSLVAQSVGLVISVACMNFEAATGISALLVLFMQLFGGFLSKNIKPWLSWTRYLSMVNYAYQNMNIIEFLYGLPIRCDTPTSAYKGCANSTYIPVEEILYKGDDPALPLWINTCCLITYLVTMRVLAYVIIRLCRKPS